MGEASADLISVPKGGGALRAVGETFQPDPHTGAGTFSIPIDLPPGRGALTPQLALAYSSGNGNGPFGMGWRLGMPGVRRRTDKRLPRYDSTDVFTLSDAEDLVPVPGAADPGVQRYRPRSESLFARIEHHTAGTDHWVVWSQAGLRSTYGTPRPADAGGAWRDPAAIADPAVPGHVLGWLITSTADTLGNTITYGHAPDPADPGGAQRYLTQIGYADYGDPASPRFLVQVRFSWEPRPDVHIDRRGGFAVATGQRCAAIETWTDPGTPQLGRRVALSYSDAANGVSLLTRVTVTGHDGAAVEALPPLELGYSAWDPAARRYQPIGDPSAWQAPATSLASRNLDLVDLFGDGLPGVLHMSCGMARYWRNRGGGRLDLPRGLPAVPGGVALGATGVQLLDADGDGRPDLLVTDGTRAGYFPVAAAGGFDPAGYVPYRLAPAFSLTEPNTRLIDLDGDGVADALRIGTSLEVYLNDRAAGWQPQPAPAGSPLEAVSFADPRVKLADMTGDGLTDVVLTGNGRVQYWPNLGYGRFGDPVTMAGSPRFDDAAWYGPTGFDPARLLVGDLDGDGAADLAYVGPRGITVWVNRTGTGFAPPVLIPATPQPDGKTAVRLADMLGTGVPGVLWTYDAGAVRGSNYKFLDLTGGTKPYLLTSVDNHAGAVTAISYAPSTRFAAADAAAGTPWRTTLPFPVHAVAATTITDYFSGTVLSSEYAYHHGYWDGADREFRGFGRVEHRDTLTPAVGADSGTSFSPPVETRSWFHLGPVGPEHGNWADLDLSGEYWPEDPILTAHLDTSGLPASLSRRALRDAVRAARGTLLRTEVYALDGTSRQGRPYEVTDHALAIAAILDGRAPDDPGWQAAPVTVAHPVLIRHAVWERGTDPMYRVQVTGGYDAYGRPADSIDVAVPRGHNPARPDPAGMTSEPYLAVHTRTSHATRDDATGYLTDRVIEVRRTELDATTATPALQVAAGVLAGTATGGSLRSLTLTFYDGPPGAGPSDPATQPGGLPYGQLGLHGLPVRVEQLAITPAQLAAASQPGPADGSLPAGPPPYLPVDGTSIMPLPPAQYPASFGAGLAPLAGYTWHADGPDPVTDAPYVAGYYTQATRHAYDVQASATGAGRGLPVAHRDALGHDTTIGYDPCDLLPARVTDPLGLVRTASYDYRTLHPAVVTDPNGNVIQAGYTPLGFLAWTASTGKPGGTDGDTTGQPGTSYSYDLTAWDASAAVRQPLSVTTTRRVQHWWTLVNEANAARAAAGQPPLTDADIAAMFPPDEADQHPERFVRTVEYSDGFGRLLQARTQADTLILDDLGLTAGQTAPPGPASAHHADPAGPAPVTVSTWKRYDNKGRVITAYEPFYSGGYPYQPPGSAFLGTLAKVETRYDPRGLAVLVTGPDGSQTLTVPGIPADLTDPGSYTPTPWVSYTYDPDDNAARTHPATSASYAAQYNTPDSTTLDPLERPATHVRRVAAFDAGAAVTTTAYDIDGNITSVTDPLGRVAIETVYDALNRAWRHASLDAGAARSVLDPAGGVTEVRDDKGAITLSAYDSGHRLTRLWAADRPGQVPTLRQVIVYGDQPDSGLTDAAAVNLMGRPYLSYDEAGLLTTPSYDLDGNLLSKTRQVLRADLLLSGLPTGPGSWDGTAYDVDWQPGPGQSLGQHAASLLDATGYQTDAAYDAFQRATTVTGPADVTGARTTLDRAYTPAGQVATITAGGTPQLARAIYNARGQRTLTVLGCGTLLRYVHDPATFRLTRLRAEPATASGAGQVTWTGTGNPQNVLQDYGYDYDLTGNLLTLRDRTPGSGLPVGTDPVRSPSPDALDRGFGYDPLYRLTSATGRETALPPSPPWLDTPAGTDITKAQLYTETYNYDLAGNLLTLRHASGTGYTRAYTPDPGTNRLATLTISGGRLAYAHDHAGNLTSEGGTRRFEWDHANRRATFRNQADGAAPSIYAQYRYDPAGSRTVKIVHRGRSAPDITVYIDGLFERLILSNATPAATTHDTTHILDDHARIGILRHGTPVPGDPYPEATYHLGDHLTSSTAVLSPPGQLLNREEYTPYGETSFGGYASKRYRYTAKERDEESGLAYHGARYFSPWTARWTSADPAGPVDGLNLYAYVRSRPTTLTDLSGRAAGYWHDVAGGIRWTQDKVAAGADAAGGWVTDKLAAAGTPHVLNAAAGSAVNTLVQVGGGLLLIGPSTALAVAEAPGKLAEGGRHIAHAARGGAWEHALEGIGNIAEGLGDIAGAVLLAESGFQAARTATARAAIRAPAKPGFTAKHIEGPSTGRTSGKAYIRTEKAANGSRVKRTTIVSREGVIVRQHLDAWARPPEASPLKAAEPRGFRGAARPDLPPNTVEGPPLPDSWTGVPDIRGDILPEFRRSVINGIRASGAQAARSGRNAQ